MSKTKNNRASNAQQTKKKENKQKKPTKDNKPTYNSSKEALAKLLVVGVSKVNLAKKFGVNERTIYKWIQKYRSEEGDVSVTKCRELKELFFATTRTEIYMMKKILFKLLDDKDKPPEAQLTLNEKLRVLDRWVKVLKLEIDVFGAFEILTVKTDNKEEKINWNEFVSQVLDGHTEELTEEQIGEINDVMREEFAI